MTKIEETIKLIIKKSGGSPEKIKLSDFMERINHCFAFAPTNYWLGVTIMKNPLDLAILQQIIFDKKPDTIIECGTAYGGSAYYMACMMDIVGIEGQVITIDHEPDQTAIYHKTDLVEINGQLVSLDVQGLNKPDHPKIKYITSECLNAELPLLGQRVMAVLDCHHSTTHVYKELEKFAKLVTPGQYIIVEDTDAQGLGGGPKAAVKKFLSRNKNFIADKNREKYGISSNLGGYLYRIS